MNHTVNTQKQIARVLIACDDKKGLIYKTSQVFFEMRLNIDSNQEFVDKQAGKFFMRTVVSGQFNVETLKGNLFKAIPESSQLNVITPEKKKIVLMVTKESHALGDILIRHSAGELEAEIQAVISNHNTLEKLVKRFDIPFYHISANDISREKHEKMVIRSINQFDFDYLVLAKYMRILTPGFVQNYSQKIINIHHSFLPAFIGANPYKQAFERGVKIIGATAHFVTNDLDEGPIINQNIVPVNHRFDWQDMQRAGRDVEKSVLSRALDLVLNDRVLIHGNKTIVF